MMSAPYIGNIDRLIADSSHATVVVDERGNDVILIGGQIIKVDPPYLADGLVRALRRRNQESENAPVRVNSGISAPQVI